jgi:hypothetical protein
MSTRVTSDFAITSWDETVYDQPEEGSKLLRATVHKSFQGEIEGTSIAELLMVRAGDEGGEGYLGSERVTASIGDLTGTFVVQHGGISSGDELFSFGYIVNESGTGDFSGISGKVAIRHDEHGATFTLDYELAP